MHGLRATTASFCSQRQNATLAWLWQVAAQCFTIGSVASQSCLQKGQVAQNRGSDSHRHTRRRERLHEAQRRLLQHGVTSPLFSQPGRSHKVASLRFLQRFGILAALTFNEEALSAFLLA